MFLKRIVLHGFKSFADRTEFEFGPGLSVIVGPNGCGKSNILDAIRWVLGEQSARTLRGQQMLDVIFSGSRSRKPANFAQVELTFDNTTRFLRIDRDEVTVGRVLYRSGESEYLLNGSVCRLKDIRELLLDTGIGVDAYSIIEQGRVDAVLQANPHQRRELFEEAAGISRYKARRTEAQRKLERAQNNLLRLQDVIDELERRLRSVKLAAGKARNYQEYDRRLRELRAAAALADYHALCGRLEAAGRRASALGDVLLAVRTELARRDAESLSLEQQAQKLEEQIAAAEQELRSAESQASTLAERVRQCEQRLSELSEGRQRHDAQMRSTSEALRELARQVERQQGELDALRDTCAQARAAVEQIDAQIGTLQQQRDEAAEALEAQRRGAFELARHVSLLHNEQNALEQQQDALAARRAQLAERLEALEAELQEASRIAEQITARREALAAEASRLAAALETVDQDIAEAEQQLAATEQRVLELSEQRSAAASRLALLEDLDQRREGVGEGTRWVLEWDEARRRAAGVIGLVADVLRIHEPRAACLLGVLEAFERDLIVERAEAFAEALGDAQPPAAFDVVALDGLAAGGGADGSHWPAGLRDEPDVIAPAAGWVACEARFEPLRDALLGRVVVVRDAAAARRLAAAYARAGLCFVGLDGHVVDARSGRWRVAGRRSGGGLISRKSEIEALRERLAGIESELTRTQRLRNDQNRRLEDLRLSREGLLQQLAETQKKEADAHAETTRLADARQRLESDRKRLLAEVAELDRGRQAAGERLRQLELELAAAGEKQAEHEQKLAALAEQLRQIEAGLRELHERRTAAEVEAARAQERLEAATRALTQVRQRYEEARSQASELEAAAARLGEQLARLERERSEARQRGVELEQQARMVRRRLDDLRTGHQRLRRRIDALRGVTRRLHAQIEQIDQRLREVEIEQHEAQVRADELVQRIQDELSLDLRELHRDYRDEPRDWDAVRAEIEELRAKIRRLGHVNLDAIAELEELTPRYENLLAQKRDLEESMSRLESLIAELNHECVTRFERSFRQIREQFQELFRKLFGGGRADIVLADPENPLECGIEILAKPPGKETRTLSLLSGGERTLAAVALLLGIFRTRPSPFAILDEVDAALDEANVDRFNMLLTEFLERSQFIVITHSKRTMQSADVLYGITMQEPGVSKRVSVRFDDRVEAPDVA